MTSSQRLRPALGLSLAAAMLALAACGGGDDASDSAATSEESTSQEESAGADDSTASGDIPDVVAEVNGEEVTKDEFVPVFEAQLQQATAQAQSTGQAPDEDAIKQQTADQLVDNELLAQEAESRGISVSEQDVEDELATLAKENQLASTDELIAALEKQGTTEEQARVQLETQMVIEQLVADEAGSVEPTEQDLRKIYADAKKQQAQMGKQGQKIPPYAQVKSQIAEQAKSEKLSEVAQSLVETLREDADIQVNL
ncbi:MULTISPECIES: SurA N-terminal domain-containing protein [Nocardioides]|uniref:SurA N-terminal domain-containing protein n=1 Tax=Nocardioides TaxID=1839 RepID=UPI000330B75D|nr:MULTISPECIES: SurA N-terminal domain-containing protein [Nocardioides]EON25566.1 SurA domain protein [Nocardioides sp. CF8]